jgi:hypothetical protein
MIMERKINLSPYSEISYLVNYQHHTLTKMASVIFEKDLDYFFLDDELEKIYDISQMPDYIKSDWIKYNKKEITVSVLNKHIAYYSKFIKDNYSETEVDSTNELLITLKSIRRDLIIKGIIK